MKKILQVSLFALFGVFALNAQNEVAPVDSAAPNGTRALFDLEYAFDIGTNGSVGANGLAGVIFFDNQYWISEWQTDVIHVLDDTGGFVESFTIPGLSGTRSLTTDGTNIYIGTAGTQIFQIDPVFREIAATIDITTASDAEARMCTYDSELDGGNGGFWIGDFSSDIASVDMSGIELSVIPAGTHGTVIYGGAVDNVSDDGPWLWVSDQSGTAPNRHFITQVDPAAGNQTGVNYDFTTDGAANGATEVLAGGLFISGDVVADQTSFVGLCQCTPSNLLFGLELKEELSTNDFNSNPSTFALFPNPANNTVQIESQFNGEKQVAIFDVIGNRVLDATVTNSIDISALSAGVYMVQLTQEGTTSVKKLVVR